MKDTEDSTVTQLQESIAKAFREHQYFTKTANAHSVVQKLLDQQKDDIVSYQDFKTEILWDTFAWSMKLKWYWMNKITSKAQIIRKNIDKVNQEASQIGDHEYIDYPVCCESWPKGILIVTSKIKLNAPIEYVLIDLPINVSY